MNKITKKQETEIISLYKTGKYSMASLGEKYSVSYTAINKLLKRNNIPSRKTWKDSKEKNKYRKCSRCGRLLPIDEFYEYSSGYLDTWCKKCNSQYAKENRNYDSIYSKYGITEKEYLRINKIQNNKCAICGKDFSDKRLYIDHDHKTGKIRGLLCGRCNTGIGMFDDNIDILMSAIKYLDDN